jgi:ADP-ribose pyrophosphatase YjhB (NUDIX family)
VTELRTRQRVGSYAVCVDDRNRLLLCRMSQRTRTPGTWTLPGGGVQHGEDPAAAALRELAEEAGLPGRVTGLLGVQADVYESNGVEIHGIRLLYLVAVDHTATRSEVAGGTDAAEWFEPGALDGLPLSAHAAAAVGRLIG